MTYCPYPDSGAPQVGFDNAWAAYAAEGRADALDSAQYVRALADWQAGGSPPTVFWWLSMWLARDDAPPSPQATRQAAPAP